MNPKIRMWDIETTNLDADFGDMICASSRILGSKTVDTVRIDRYKGFRPGRRPAEQEKKMLIDLVEQLSDSDVWVTWYGSRFDVPFVNSRLLFHGLNPLPNVPHIDGWRVAKYQLKMSSNRLMTVSAFLGVAEKTPLKGPIWIEARYGNKKAIDYIVKHCEQDVIVLEEAYERFKSVIPNHPNVALIKGKPAHLNCGVCGSGKYRRGGYNVALTRRTVRLQCLNCGKWRSVPERVLEDK